MQGDLSDSDGHWSVGHRANVELVTVLCQITSEQENMHYTRISRGRFSIEMKGHSSLEEMISFLIRISV